MADRFTIAVTPSFRRDLEALSAEYQARVLAGIRVLAENPHGPPPKIKKLKGQGIGQWRLEMWPYRVRYDVIGREVVLYRVRHRREVYRD